jgi:hypothetical protein
MPRKNFSEQTPQRPKKARQPLIAAVRSRRDANAMATAYLVRQVTPVVAIARS